MIIESYRYANMNEECLGRRHRYSDVWEDEEEEEEEEY
jgi:hypothetical protein